MRGRPFTHAQIDTAFLADGKVRRLLRSTKDPLDFYAAVGVYMTAVLAAWRLADPAVLAEIEDAPPRIRNILQEVGLLDGSGIPARSFDRWVGQAMEAQRRDRHREVVRRSRERAQDGGSPSQEMQEVTTGHSRSQQSPVTSPLSISLSSLSISGSEGVQGEDPELAALDTYWSLSGKYPKGRAKAWLERLAEEYGGEAVARALAKVPRESLTLIQDAESILTRGRAEAEVQDRHRKDEERKQAARDRANGRPGLQPPLDPAEYDRLRAEVQG